MTEERSSGERQQRKILVIEDDDDTRVLYGQHFEGRGYQVEMAADGNEGISRALRMQPDVIVLDLAMPRLDGWEAVGVLRTYPTTATIPVVACSGSNEEGLRRAIVAGCNATVRKPCSPEDLERVVTDLLESTSSRTSSAG